MVNINKVHLTKLQQEILRLLFIRAGETINQNRISKILKVTPPAVKKALLGLKDFIELSKDKESKRLSIKINRQSKKVIQLKRADNLKLIYESNLANFLEDNYPGATIILFGSYSRGEDTTNSDIDIAIIGRKEKKLGLENFEVILNRKINRNFYGSFRDIHINLKENLCNGIILAGSVEL